MRELAGREAILRLFRALGEATDEPTSVYLTGGASAVLLGWRASTIDVDLSCSPPRDELYRAIARLKDELSLNVEEVSPAHFIPELPGWRERCVFIHRERQVSFLHYDFYAQALAKIERGHEQDRLDVTTMLDQGCIEPARLRELYESIVPQLYRYPALDEGSFRAGLDEALAGRE